MIINEEGYASQYATDKVRNYARAVANVLPMLMGKYGAAAVVVSGNSGISIGHAALMLIDFPLVLVRKNTENSHGSPIEGPKGLIFYRYIILDDFVGTGDTVRRIVDTISARDPIATPVCVLQYTQNGGHGRLEYSSAGPIPVLGITGS